MTKRRQLPAKEYGRCTRCGRLTEKASLRRGPEGGWLGPDCYSKTLTEHADREKG